MSRCPTCDSPAAHLHPAVQFGGEVQVCFDSFHDEDSTNLLPCLSTYEITSRYLAKKGYDYLVQWRNRLETNLGAEPPSDRTFENAMRRWDFRLLAWLNAEIARRIVRTKED